MARSRIFDFLQQYPFWLLDATPSLTPPYFVFTPILGFQSISAPEITLETQDINPGNSLFPKHKVIRAEVAPITLIRGSQFFDADYWNWIYATAAGRSNIRRDLMLIHYMGYDFGRVGISGLAGSVAISAGVALSGSLSLGAAAGVAAAQTAAAAFGSGVFKESSRVPAKAWMLRHCLPTRYKAASDFDATSGEVSLQELDVQPEYFDEISLAAS